MVWTYEAGGRGIRVRRSLGFCNAAAAELVTNAVASVRSSYLNIKSSHFLTFGGGEPEYREFLGRIVRRGGETEHFMQITTAAAAAENKTFSPSELSKSFPLADSLERFRLKVSIDRKPFASCMSFNFRIARSRAAPICLANHCYFDRAAAVLRV